MHRIMLALSLVTITACGATSFTGDANIEGGPRACYQRCQGVQMRMSQFVYMGEYSTACVCELPNANASAGPTSGASAAAVGVVLQMRAAAEQQRHQQATVVH